jgi:hypothetical protein
VFTGPRSNRDGQALTGEFFDDLRDERNPALAFRGLLRDTKAHKAA